MLLNFRVLAMGEGSATSTAAGFAVIKTGPALPCTDLLSAGGDGRGEAVLRKCEVRIVEWCLEVVSQGRQVVGLHSDKNLTF